MKIPMIAVVGLTATTMVVGVSVAGCGSNKSSTTSSSGSSTSSASKSVTSSSSSAQTADYTALLIKSSDITLPGDTFTDPPPIQTPNGQPGVATVFTNQTDTREISDDILILPDAPGAVNALNGSTAALGNTVTGGTPVPAAVGTAGTMVSGTTPDGSKAMTVLLFTEGKAFTNLEFLSAPNDPMPPQFVTDVGQMQDTAIKNGLPG
ncbi:MAG: hypothetical protein QOC63_2379 [Mycobacterium sp.]|jgi:hypothetical protein|nr:hypothetical protein [Mycobacterium sp.]